MNLLEGTVTVSGDDATVSLGEQSLHVPACRP